MRVPSTDFRAPRRSLAFAAVASRTLMPRVWRPVLPHVKAFADLLSQPAGAHHLPQEYRGAEALAQLTMKLLEEGQTDVEPHEVAKLERPHRVPIAELHRAVDVGYACHTAFEH